MSGTSPQLRCFLVEWYRAGLTAETLDTTTALLDDCAATLSAEGSTVRLVTALAVPTDDVIFGVFAAGSAEVVAATCDRAGLPALRLSDAIDAKAEAVT